MLRALRVRRPGLAQIRRAGTRIAAPKPTGVLDRQWECLQRHSGTETRQQRAHSTATPAAALPAAAGVAQQGAAQSAGRSPWDVLCAELDRTELTGAGLSVKQFHPLLRLLMTTYKRNNADGWAEVREWVEHTDRAAKNPAGHRAVPSGPGAGAVRYYEELPAEQQVERQIVLAHVMTLELKAEVARGQHMGAPMRQRPRPRGWASQSDVRATQVALAARALHARCPGVLLNILVDWNTGAELVSKDFLASVCRAHLQTRAQLAASVQDSRQVFNAVVHGPPHGARPAKACNRATTTRFVDALWDADNVAAGTAILERLVAAAGGAQDGRAVDQLVASLAIQLMEAAARFGQMEAAYSVFELCEPWLHQSAVAYNVLLRPAATEYDMQRVVALLRRMRTSGTVPDAVTWTTIMAGMCQNSKLVSARKLFSAHLLFLPLHPLADAHAESPPSGAQILYSPLHQPSAGRANLWETWHYQSTNPHYLDTFIWSWLSELASRYHREQKQQQSACTVKPWLPTQATHYVLLKSLCQSGEVAQAVEYMALLTRVWGQYRAWAWPRRHDNNPQPADGDAGLERLRRLVVGYMCEDLDKTRAVYGLGRGDAGVSDNAGVAGYYAHCAAILSLARGEDPERPHGAKEVLPADRPPRVVYAKALHGYALRGDMQALLGHMQRFRSLNDIAAWTCVVQCICVQISLRPDDELMLRPQMYGRDPAAAAVAEERDWLDFVFELARALAANGVYFTQVTFGQLVQMAARLDDMRGLQRITREMYQRSEVRLNSDMLKMVLRVDLPYAAKCTLVRAALDAHMADGLAPAKSTTAPEYPVLAHLVRIAETPEDVACLCPVADELKRHAGMVLLPPERTRLRSICTGHSSAGHLQQWLAANSGE